jgi:hypothetical protein
LGLVVGSALLYSAVQPRTVYYESRTIYAPAPLPPSVTVYYTPQTVVRSDTIYVAPSEQTVTTIVPVPSLPGSSAGLSAHSNAQPGPGASGAQWWYLCRNPSGYYPHIMECPSGWEKVAPSLPPER